MKLNDALPRIDVDPETYVVKADGQVLKCDPMACFPWPNATSFFSRLVKMASSFVLSRPNPSTYLPSTPRVRTPCGLAGDHFDQPLPWLLLSR